MKIQTQKLTRSSCKDTVKVLLSVMVLSLTDNLFFSPGHQFRNSLGRIVDFYFLFSCVQVFYLYFGVSTSLNDDTFFCQNQSAV